LKKLRHLALAVSVAVLGACATTTPYQEATKPGAYDGYTETMLTNNKARVTFGGNSLTDRETVENYLLYRAAEMAVERGYDHFSLAERDTEAKTERHANPRSGFYDPYFDYSFYRPRFGWSPYDRYSRFYDPYYRSRSRSSFYAGRGFGSDPFFRDFNGQDVTKYRATAEVTFGHGSGREADNVFNARQVLDNLGSKIIYPEDKA